MKNTPLTSPRDNAHYFALLLLAIIISLLFWRSFLPGYVHFSNDGPLGQQNVHWQQLPGGMTGMWDDLNDVGFGVGTFTPSIRGLIFWSLGPVGYSKFYAPVSLFILGLGVLAFLRALKFTPFAATMGMLAAVLNSAYFAGACWGIASIEISIGMNFFALALAFSNSRETPALTYWLRLVLAGLCVGMNVIEGADIGALCSVLVAITVFFKALLDAEGKTVTKIFRGVSQVAIIAVFAGFMALQTVIALIGNSITGVAGTAQDSETKAAHWDWATQWSIPKTETLGLIVPGLFGYKMDTPKDMMPAVAKFYDGGNYWGGVGRDPVLDRYYDAGEQGPPPASSFQRFTGGGDYCGILVILVAAWTLAQSFRRENSPFTSGQKKFIWFWGFVASASLLLAWGRFAPMFYGALYQLPYFSTIRNPCKFIIFFCWALVILFAYGLSVLGKQLDEAAPAGTFKNWWARAAQFDRRWIFGCGAALAASVLGWMIFSSERSAFVMWLQKRGFPGEDFAGQIANFSIAQAGWFVALLAVAVVLFTQLLAGSFRGSRARLGMICLGGFLLFDLGRANLPYVIHWDYQQKYEVGTLNPVVAQLTKNPWEQRVAGLPFHAPEGMELLDQVYRIEWMQHHFPYYNIQCLDLIQMPRMAADLKMYLEALSPRGTAESAPLIMRRWELSNTRYLIGPAGYLEVMNQQLDPVQHRFRFAQRFEIVPKPGVLQPQRLEELTATLNDNGKYALFEFTGALPRAKLYANWQVSTNDQDNLKKLTDLNFDPAKTVLVSTPEKTLATVATNDADAGTVEFKSYSPKKIIFNANAKTPAVLLLNDKFDTGWSVTVDGQPAPLLRCNFLMRGVALTPGAHEVQFYYSQPEKPLFVTLAAIVLMALLTTVLFVAGRTPRLTN
jgi:hypothetical protein